MISRILNPLLYFIFELLKLSGWRKHYFLFILLRSQWDDKKIKSIAKRKVKFLMIRIKRINPYYREKFKYVVSKVSDISNLLSFPILEKKDLQEHNHELCSTIKVQRVKSKTSGSTGVPVMAYIDRYALDWRIAGYYRFLSWYGIKPYDRYVLLWAHAKFNTKTFKVRLKKFFYAPQFFINVFELNEQTFISHYNALVSYKPVYFKSYPSGAWQFAYLAGKLNYDLKKLNIKLVITTGELLDDEKRSFIESAFGCKVANEYGAAEVAQIAFECPHGSMHVPEELVYIWTNEQDEVFVTNLDNVYFPFINYRVGDLVKISKTTCSCGREGQILSSIVGRNSDQIILPNGKVRSQTTFTYLFKEVGLVFGLQCIEQWRVTQEGNHFTFEIVKGSRFVEESIPFVKQKCLNDIDTSITITFIFKDTIEKEKSGKLRYFIRKS